MKIPKQPPWNPIPKPFNPHLEALLAKSICVAIPEPQRYLKKWPFALFSGVLVYILPTFGGRAYGGLC